jgi:hypothetical protein
VVAVIVGVLVEVDVGTAVAVDVGMLVGALVAVAVLVDVGAVVAVATCVSVARGAGVAVVDPPQPASISQTTANTVSFCIQPPHLLP